MYVCMYVLSSSLFTSFLVFSFRSLFLHPLARTHVPPHSLALPHTHIRTHTVRHSHTHTLSLSHTHIPGLEHTGHPAARIKHTSTQCCLNPSPFPPALPPPLLALKGVLGAVGSVYKRSHSRWLRGRGGGRAGLMDEWERDADG